MTQFKELMDHAQALHGERAFGEAVVFWNLAQGLAPDDSERGRALRGEGASLWRLGDTHPPGRKNSN